MKVQSVGEAKNTTLRDPTRREQGQFEKSSNTRRKILDAAMGLLAEHGFSEFTAGAVAKRAGLTRAALIYHFANRSILLEATILHVTRRRIEIYEEALHGVPRDDDFSKRSFALAWQYLDDEAFRAFCQLSMAAQTNPDLNAVFEPALMAYDRARRETADKLFPEEIKNAPSFNLRRDLVRYTLEGLAQQGGMSFDSDKRTRHLLNLLELLMTTDEGRAFLDKAVTKPEKPD